MKTKNEFRSQTLVIKSFEHLHPALFIFNKRTCIDYGLAKGIFQFECELDRCYRLQLYF